MQWQINFDKIITITLIKPRFQINADQHDSRPDFIFNKKEISVKSHAYMQSNMFEILLEYKFSIILDDGLHFYLCLTIIKTF